MIQEFIQLFDWSHLASGAVGGIAAAIAAHFLTKDREHHQAIADAAEARRVRIQEFVVFLRGWRSDIETFKIKQISGSIWDVIQAVYIPHIRPLQEAITKVEGDFADRDTFHRLTDRLAGLDDKYKDWNAKKQPREMILEAIDDLDKFIHAA